MRWLGSSTITRMRRPPAGPKPTPPWASSAGRNFLSASQSSSGASADPPSLAQGASRGGDGVAGDHDRRDGGGLAGSDQGGELVGVKIGEIVDCEQGRRDRR